IIPNQGAPREMVSDYLSYQNIVKDINQLCQTLQLLTTVYHPETNGLTEGLNRTLA
ncbi:hypothetical protein NPIL_519951, partial [Nephila pilipes]